MVKSTETTNRPPLGRPLKGKDRRLQIGVYVAGSTLDIVDNYINKQQETVKRQYSRSDFVNEALELYLGELGLGDEHRKTGSA